MKNGLTRTQFFWSFIGRKSLFFFFFFLVTFREIGVLFCNYFPCLLYIQCLPQIFEIKVWLFVIFLFLYIWSILELYFDCLCKYGLCILNPLSMKFKWNLKSMLYICKQSLTCSTYVCFEFASQFCLDIAKIASKTHLRHNQLGGCI